MASHKPSAESSPSVTPPKLLEPARDRIRRKAYTYRTRQSHAQWIKRFMLHHDKGHPSEMAKGSRGPVSSFKAPAKFQVRATVSFST